MDLFVGIAVNPLYNMWTNFVSWQYREEHLRLSTAGGNLLCDVHAHLKCNGYRAIHRCYSTFALLQCCHIKAKLHCNRNRLGIRLHTQLLFLCPYQRGIAKSLDCLLGAHWVCSHAGYFRLLGKDFPSCAPLVEKNCCERAQCPLGHFTRWGRRSD